MLTEYSHANCSLTAWAYAKIGIVNAGPLLDALAAHSLPLISAFDPQNLANLAWAFANCGIWHAPLLEAIAATSIRKIAQTALREMGCTAWAFDVLNLQHVPLLASISRESQSTEAEGVGDLAALVDFALSCGAGRYVWPTSATMDLKGR